MNPGPEKRLRRTAAIAIPLLLFLSLVCWAFASPVASSPDDNFHLPSIWCGLGDREGLCEPSGDPDTRLVPTSVLTGPCYAFRPEESAACWNPDDDALTEATSMNASGAYPPLFYATMGVFAGEDISTSVIVMRIVNSAIFVGLLTAVFFVLPTRVRPALLISTLATSVPLGLFVVASTNPSSWAIASAAMVWVCLYGATQSEGRRQIVLGALAVIGAIIGAGARADAAMYAVFAVLLAAVLGARRGRSMLIPAVAAGLVIVVSAAFYLSAGQTGALTSGFDTGNPPLTGAQHLANLWGIPSLWFGVFGPSGLGWLDTVPPATVTVAGFGVFAAAVFIGIHRLRPRRAVALALALAALWAMPFVLLAQSRAMVGTQVQSRYLLPLMILLLGIASLAPRIASAWSGPRLVVAGLALTLAMSLSLHDNIRRYTVGVDSNAIDPGLGAEWWWAAAPTPLTIWLVGTAAFAAVFAILWMLLRRIDDPDDGAIDDPDDGAIDASEPIAQATQSPR